MEKAEKRLLKRQDQRKRKLEEAGIKYDFEAVAYVGIFSLFPSMLASAGDMMYPLTLTSEKEAEADGGIVAIVRLSDGPHCAY